MEDFSRHLSINGTLTLICCIFCIFLPEGKAVVKTTSKTVGSRVNLPCSNESISMISQLTWKMNGVNMASLNFRGELHISPEGTNLTLNMSTLSSQLYALIIESAQIYHTGNYSCEVVSKTNGPWEQNWRLIINESAESIETWNILMIATVSSVVLLIILIGLAILIRCSKWRTANRTLSTISQTRQPTEDIYENCLEIERYNRRHGQPNKSLPVQYQV